MDADDESAWLRLESWIRSVGTTTLPLLAGFSTTSVVVVADGADHFFDSGVTILLLTAASVSLILAVQRAYHVCMFLADGTSAADGRANVWRMMRQTRRAYRIGVVFFLAGLALAVAPQHPGGVHGFGVQEGLRWCATAVAGIVCVYELVWTVRDLWPQRGA